MSLASPQRVAGRRPPALRRSWLFCPGADREALLAAGSCGAPNSAHNHPSAPYSMICPESLDFPRKSCHPVPGRLEPR